MTCEVFKATVRTSVPLARCSPETKLNCDAISVNLSHIADVTLGYKLLETFHVVSQGWLVQPEECEDN